MHIFEVAALLHLTEPGQSSGALGVLRRGLAAQSMASVGHRGGGGTENRAGAGALTGVCALCICGCRMQMHV